MVDFQLLKMVTLLGQNARKDDFFSMGSLTGLEMSISYNSSESDKT